MKDERTIHRLPRLNKSKSRFNRAGADYTERIGGYFPISGKSNEYFNNRH
jgi:hypothetical protein